MFKKLIFILFLNLYFNTLHSQAFDYERAWGTYYGPAGGHFNIFESFGSFLIDSQNNINLRGHVEMNNSLGDSYYNQYVTPIGGQGITMNIISNQIQTKFSSSGSLLASAYTGNASVNSTEEHLAHIDVLGNYYYIKEQLAPLSDTATPNTWFPIDPILSTSNNTPHQLLIKKSSNGTILWKTFLPTASSNVNSIVSDESGNIYVCSDTFVQQGVGTSGSFKQNYQIKYSGTTIQPNAFVAKLGLQGQLLWGTYLPTASSSGINYYNQQLFLIGGPDLDDNIPQLATSNTWQTSPGGGSSATALDTQTGTRLWGTYIGSAQSSGVGTNVKANSTGIYILGIELDPGSSYFSTPGAYKTQVTGGSDYFITKLDFTGNRVWGTYFGSDGYEDLLTANPIALTDTGVFIAGSISGTHSNIATPNSFLDTPPSNGNSSVNFFFAKFDLAGNLNWSSYYGGPQYVIGPQYRSINIFAPDDSTFYLYGGTGSATGIATSGAAQPQLPLNIGGYSAGFLARFNYNGELSAAESHSQNLDLVLYNNPNNGIFTLDGKILGKEPCRFLIYDASGRMLHQQEMKKEKKQTFNLQSKLTVGNYLLQVENSKKQKIKVFKLMIK